ncbi:hypothetical protein ACHWQZ_G007874 [Mnemiopsis leidyi]
MKVHRCTFTFLIVLALSPQTANADVPQGIKFGDTVEDYIIFAPNMEPFTEQFSLCSWVRKLRTAVSPTWFSYATISRSWEIIISDDGHSRLFSAHALHKIGQLDIAPGTWYHYCMCWSLSSNTADVYHNGMKVGSLKSRPGRRLRTGGSLVLGQLQYSYRTVSGHPFGGELSKLNIYSKKFSAEEVRDMYRAGLCSQIEKSHGNFRQLTWESIIQQSRRGNVQLVDAEFADSDIACSSEQSSHHGIDTDIDLGFAGTDCGQQLNIVQSKLEALKIDLESLNQTQSDSQITLTELDLTITDRNRLLTELDSTKTELTVVQSDLESTQMELGATQSELEKIRGQLRVAQTQLEATKNDLGQRLNQTQTQLNESQYQFKILQTDKAETETELAAIQTELSATQIDLEATKLKLEGAENQLQSTKIDAGQVLDVTLNELDETKTELEETRTDLQEIETVLERTQAELEISQTQLEESQTELLKARTQLEKGQTELAKTQTQLEEGQTELETSQTQLKESQTELEKNRALLEETTTELGETQFQLAQAIRGSSSDVPQVLKFGRTLQDFVMFRPNMGSFTDQFSICSWVRKLRTEGFPCWFNYATATESEIGISDHGYNNLLGNVLKVDQLDVTSGTWYHYCMSWSASSRSADVYYDGTKVGSIETPSGKRLGTGGSLVLGQYQRALGVIETRLGDRYSFGGDVFKMNIFSKKLSGGEVRDMHQAGMCSDIEKTHGDFRALTWESIIQQRKIGNVQLVDLDAPCTFGGQD